MDYHPHSSNIGQPSVPEQLLEKVARRVHEQWVCTRQRQGWVWGKFRNDEKKEHPSIVPYDMLTDEEKEVDRVTVKTVIATLLAMGATFTLDD